jgi:hypothetical protein
MIRTLAITAALFVGAASTAVFAQSEPVTPPPAVGQKAPPATPPVQPPGAAAPSPSAPPERMQGEAAPSPPSTPSATGADSEMAESGSCRTRKPTGENCACLKDTSTIGVSKAASNGGRNFCVVS